MVEFEVITQQLRSLATIVQKRRRFLHLERFLVATAVGLIVALFLAQVGWAAAAMGVLKWGFLLAILVVVFFELRALKISGDLATLAALSDHLAPELGTGTQSAIQLWHHLQKSSNTFSPDLIQNHIRQTAHHLTQLPIEQRLKQKNERLLRQTRVFLFSAFGLLVIATFSFTNGRTRLWQYLRDPNAARMSDVPLVGDIKLTYHFPAYTGLSQRVVEGGDGSLSAVVGTEVEITAQTMEKAEKAEIHLYVGEIAEPQRIAMSIGQSRQLSARLPIRENGRYHFAVVQDGDEAIERRGHTIVAIADAHPEISLVAPTADVEVKDNQHLEIVWDAQDDFDVSEVALVIEKANTEPQRVTILTQSPDKNQRREGRYQWALAETGLLSGGDARFYLEVTDNDTVTGPKKGTSATRQLKIFSAQKHHQELLDRQKQVLDMLVDILGDDLLNTSGAAANDNDTTYLEQQERHVQALRRVAQNVENLVDALRDDKLSKPAYREAFRNVLDHLHQRADERSAALSRKSPVNTLRALQTQTIATLEKDVIYLDDLLALQKIDALKLGAKDLLAAQRELQKLLEQYRSTQDPALKASLEKRIRELKQQMMELLAQMASIKESLPGEYRNLESAAMLKLDDQMDRLEQMLAKGDLEAAAKELEQLANMVENMANSINKAEEEFGGEKYAELRAQLAEFANQFKKLEQQQQSLQERSNQLLGDYRKKALEHAGQNLENFVKKARNLTLEALKELDKTEESAASQNVEKQLQEAQQSLLDLDQLLQHRDFAEAREQGDRAANSADMLRNILDNRSQRWGAQNKNLREGAKHAAKAAENTDELAELLNKLFPDPNDVLSSEQRQQMQKLAQKQSQLEKEASELGQQMQELSENLPLFGGEPRQSLDAAASEMGDAGQQMKDGNLPNANGHGRRAVEELAKLRQALEQASKGQQGGLPLPLGMGGRAGGSNENSQEDVQIPQNDKNRAQPRFRKDLLEAAKQKPPTNFEESVRRYYQELIR